MLELPELLSSGEPARLIPVVADTSRENRAASILLANLGSVPELARVLFGAIGVRVGVRSKIQCFTEVVLKQRQEGARIRPDGLITISSGTRSWSTIMEAKIGRTLLDEGQVKDYLRLAKLNGVDAVITISNQFVALPTHHPIDIQRNARRGVELFHWSWMYVVTEARLLLADSETLSPERRFLLEEMVRYFSHESIGVSGFDAMNPEWRELVLKIQSGAPINKAAPEVVNSVAAWHQESRDLCLIMCRLLGANVRLRLAPAHRKDAAEWLHDDSDRLAKSAVLECVLDVPDAADSITVQADIRRRVVTCSMRLDAPKDKKRTSARINWLLRQLSTVDPEDVYLAAIWPGRAPDTQAQLAVVRENPGMLEAGNPALKPLAFKVLLVRDLAGKFSGRRTFIEKLETVVPDFYQRVGQHLRAWVPPPPPLKESDRKDDEEPQLEQKGKAEGDKVAESGTEPSPSSEHPNPPNDLVQGKDAEQSSKGTPPPTRQQNWKLY